MSCCTAGNKYAPEYVKIMIPKASAKLLKVTGSCCTSAMSYETGCRSVAAMISAQVSTAVRDALAATILEEIFLKICTLATLEGF